jgi:hypothetical protein
MAGLGLPHLLRWLWWRANAWTEISGMLIGFSLALTNFLFGRLAGFPEGQMSIFPGFMAVHAIHVICWISLISSVVAIAVTMLTKPIDEAQLRRFVEKVKPMGFWKGHNKGFTSERSFALSVFYWLLGTGAIYAAMFGIGYLLRLEYLSGTMLLVFGVAALWYMVRGMSKIDRQQ